jgi:hypothetical protein
MISDNLSFLVAIVLIISIGKRRMAVAVVAFALAVEVLLRPFVLLNGCLKPGSVLADVDQVVDVCLDRTDKALDEGVDFGDGKN